MIVLTSDGANPTGLVMVLTSAFIINFNSILPIHRIRNNPDSNGFQARAYLTNSKIPQLRGRHPDRNHYNNKAGSTGTLVTANIVY